VELTDALDRTDVESTFDESLALADAHGAGQETTHCGPSCFR
jgi:hypothetical protein